MREEACDPTALFELARFAPPVALPEWPPLPPPCHTQSPEQLLRMPHFRHRRMILEQMAAARVVVVLMAAVTMAAAVLALVEALVLAAVWRLARLLRRRLLISDRVHPSRLSFGEPWPTQAAGYNTAAPAALATESNQIC